MDLIVLNILILISLLITASIIGTGILAILCDRKISRIEMIDSQKEILEELKQIHQTIQKGKK